MQIIVQMKKIFFLRLIKLKYRIIWHISIACQAYFNGGLVTVMDGAGETYGA